MADYRDMVFGSDRNRPARRQERQHEHRHDHHDMGDDMMDLGKMAVGGMITVGVINAFGNVINKD